MTIVMAVVIITGVCNDRSETRMSMNDLFVGSAVINLSRPRQHAVTEAERVT